MWAGQESSRSFCWVHSGSLRPSPRRWSPGSRNPHSQTSDALHTQALRAQSNRAKQHVLPGFPQEYLARRGPWPCLQVHRHFPCASCQGVVEG